MQQPVGVAPNPPSVDRINLLTAADYEEMCRGLKMMSSSLEWNLRNRIAALTVMEIKSVIQYLNRKFQLPMQSKSLKKYWIAYLESILFQSRTSSGATVNGIAPATPTAFYSGGSMPLPNISPAMGLSSTAAKPKLVAPITAATSSQSIPPTVKINFPMVVFQKNDPGALSGIYNVLRTLTPDFCHYFDFRGYYNGSHFLRKEYTDIQVHMSGKHLKRLRSPPISSNVPAGGTFRMLLVFFRGANQYLQTTDLKITIRTLDATATIVVTNKTCLRLLTVFKRIGKIYEAYIEKKSTPPSSNKKPVVPTYLTMHTHIPPAHSSSQSSAAPANSDPSTNSQPKLTVQQDSTSSFNDPQPPHSSPLSSASNANSTPSRSQKLNLVDLDPSISSAPIFATPAPPAALPTFNSSASSIPTIQNALPSTLSSLASLSGSSEAPPNAPPKRDLVTLRQKALELFSQQQALAQKNDDNAEDIEIGDTIISFTCPVSLARITDPVKGENCRHLQCFDLRAFLDMLYLKPWKCSVCGANLRADTLIVDMPSLRLLEKYSHADRCVVKSDGTDAPFDTPGAGEAKVVKDAESSRSARQSMEVVEILDDDIVVEVSNGGIGGGGGGGRGGGSGHSGGASVGRGTKRKASSSFAAVDVDEQGDGGGANKRARSPTERRTSAGGAIAPGILLIEID
ncbi:SUMO ligase siz1 [Phlyctochytrium planicorne]|nr:SUMO ligase siz1 [Phlyctochytrium planicorne]